VWCWWVGVLPWSSAFTVGAMRCTLLVLALLLGVIDALRVPITRRTILHASSVAPLPAIASLLPSPAAASSSAPSAAAPAAPAAKACTGSVLDLTPCEVEGELTPKEKGRRRLAELSKVVKLPGSGKGAAPTPCEKCFTRSCVEKECRP
jgi:hypothetical protein